MTKQVRMMLLGAVAVAFVAGSAVSARAEEPTTKPASDKVHVKKDKPAGEHMAKLPKGFNKLDLTEAQKTQIADIQKQAEDSIKTAGKDEAAVKTIKEDTKTKLLAVLTDEQKAKLAAAATQKAATQKATDEEKKKNTHTIGPKKEPKTEGTPKTE